MSRDAARQDPPQGNDLEAQLRAMADGLPDGYRDAFLAGFDGKPPPPPPRRSGCSIFGWLPLVVLLVALVAAPQSQKGGGYLAAVQRMEARAFIALPAAAVQSAQPVQSAPAATPTGSVGSALIGGWATYYSDPSQRIDHYAAAGPLLRDALGHWRGKVIRVTSGSRSTIVRLADFCACGQRHGLPTLLDLSPEAFRDLAPLSAGIVRVEIELVELPATDALPRNASDLRMMLEVRDDAAYR